MNKRIRYLLLALLALSLVSSSLVSPALGQAFTATRIKVLHLGQPTLGLWVNASGQVVGSRDTVYEHSFRCCRAFFWSRSTGTIDLGSLGGGFSMAFAINDNGQATGWSFTQDQQSHAYLWTLGGGMQDLGVPVPSTMDRGRRINSSGQVAGTYVGANGYTQHAFFWTRFTGMQDLGTLPGGYSSEALAANDSGQVVGDSTATGGYYSGPYAFRWTEAGGMEALLGNDTTSVAFDINNAGQIVGVFEHADGTLHGFLWSQDQGMQDLGSVGGCCRETGPFAINDKGQVIGTQNYLRPFLWTPEAGMLDLNSLVSKNLQLTNAWSINNSGQIAVSGGVLSYSVYLLTPKMASTLASSANPSPAGQPVTFSATVNSVTGPPPDGENVTFTDGTAVLAVVSLVQGTASFTTSSLKAGKHRLRATYAGDATYASSRSAILKQIVSP